MGESDLTVRRSHQLTNRHNLHLKMKVYENEPRKHEIEFEITSLISTNLSNQYRAPNKPDFRDSRSPPIYMGVSVDSGFVPMMNLSGLFNLGNISGSTAYAQAPTRRQQGKDAGVCTQTVRILASSAVQTIILVKVIDQFAQTLRCVVVTV